MNRLKHGKIFAMIGSCLLLTATLLLGCSAKPAVPLSREPGRSDVVLSPPGEPEGVDAGMEEAPAPEHLPVAEPAPPRVFELEERIFDLGKAKQRVLVRGPGDGLPVLLLHGATFRAEIWEDLGTLTLLAESGYLAIAADLPGHGKTGRSGLSAFRHGRALIEALELDRPVVLGHSYAGAFLLPLVAKNGELLRGAVLISPSKIGKNEKALKGNPLPAVVMWGRNDDLIPLSFAHRLAAALPNSKKVIFENAGHECYNDATEDFHKELLAFLKTLD